MDSDDNLKTLLDEEKAEKKINSIYYNMGQEDDSKKDFVDSEDNRVMAHLISTIVVEDGVPRLDFMSKEYQKLIVKVDGLEENILKLMNLSDPLKKRFDFVFITQKAAESGRSIPPETRVGF